MLIEEGIRHGRMAAPAEKAHVSPESNVRRSVYLRIWCCRVAKKAYRFAIHLHNITATAQHDVGINRCILIPQMTLETYRSPVGIWTFPQKPEGSFMRRSAVDFMTGQTPHLPFIQREREISRVARRKILRMMVFTVVMTVKAYRRWVSIPREKSRPRLWLFSPMTEITGTVRVNIRRGGHNLAAWIHDLLHVAGHHEGR